MVSRSVIIAITIALFVIGSASIILLVFDFLSSEQQKNSKPYLLSKNEAIFIATRDGNWNDTLLEGKQIKAQMLHVKNDGFTFQVDEKTLEDGNLFMSKFEKFENRYLWLVQISSFGGSNRSWEYLIDASSAKILLPQEEITKFEPVDPDVSVKNSIPILQAKGNVTIVFPHGIAEGEDKVSPFPAQLIITRDDTITWFNNDTISHTVTSGFPEQEEWVGRIFDSGIIAPQRSFSFTFNDERASGYGYFCSIHPWMRGGILISD